jgi:hypothetical protein
MPENNPATHLIQNTAYETKGQFTLQGIAQKTGASIDAARWTFSQMNCLHHLGRGRPYEFRFNPISDSPKLDECKICYFSENRTSGCDRYYQAQSVVANHTNSY